MDYYSQGIAGEPVRSGPSHGFKFEAQTFSINNSNMYDIAGNMVVNNVEMSREEMKALLAGTMSEDRERLFNQLNRVVEAPYNSSARESASGCMPGTRTAVLQKIRDWTSTDGTLLFWLNGMAGTGKSAIAHSTAMECHASGTLGASFFFSRDQQARREMRHLFQSIAFQLGNGHPVLKAAIADVLKDQTILTSNLRTQLRELILNPISDLQHPSPIVIVLDALDECEDENAVVEIIDLLVTEMATRNFCLKFFVTSRPERILRQHFESLFARHATRRFVLHEVNTLTVDLDIQLFIQHELTRIAEKNLLMLTSMKSSWPTAADVTALVKISGGLFVAASTATRFVLPVRGSLDPRHRLHTLLEFYTKGVRPINLEFESLDRMYASIIVRATSNRVTPEVAERFRMVTGTLVLSYARFTIGALSNLLQIKDEDVISMLEELRSVILIPEENQGVIQAFHQSFHDYLTDETRCSDPRFYINARRFHATIASLCLDRMMQELKRDMCNIRYSWNIGDNVREELQQRIADVFPFDIQYACKYWPLHLAECTLDGALLDSVTHFAFEKILYWIEALSLLGELGNGIASLRKARLQLALQDIHKKLLELLEDTEHFMIEFYYVISKSPLQVYHSALPFTPRNTLLYRQYVTELSTGPHLIRGFKSEWDPCLLKIDTYSLPSNVAISHSGARIAAGIQMHKMGTIRIWDIHTGAQVSKLDNHAHRVLSIAFFHDDSRLITGSNDGIVRLWDAEAGVELVQLLGHRYWVVSVAVSPDDNCVVSGSFDNTIRVWDVENRAELHKLEGHSDCVNCVAFSADGSRIVSGSEDKTICIWDAVQGIRVRKFEAQSASILAVAIFNDGTHIASGYSDNVIRIWESESGVLLTEIIGHSGRIKSLSVSYDGKLLISGSDDSTICIWDAATGRHIRTLEGHTDCVDSVAISRDTTRIVSDSKDRTIRIWDISARQRDDAASRPWDRFTRILSGEKSTGFHDGHSAAVSAIAFSHNGSRVVSGSVDASIFIWNSENGARLRKLLGHSGRVQSLDFSGDDTRIVSYSDDMTIRIWHAFTGITLHTIKTLRHSGADVQFHPMQHSVVTKFAKGLTQDRRDVMFDPFEYKIPLLARPLSGHMRPVHEVSDNDKYQFRNVWVIRNEKEIIWIPDAYRGVTDSQNHISPWVRG